MTDRIAPKTGYAFGNKAQYRRDVWGELARLSPTTPQDAQVMLLPSIEGLEIEVAAKSGFLIQNQFVIDKNPAIVATLKRRFGEIHTYGVDCWSAANRHADKYGPTISACNLDLTGCLSESLGDRLWRLVSSGALVQEAAIAITVLRGRESAETIRWMESCANEYGDLIRLSHADWTTELDRLRICALIHSVAGNAFRLTYGAYVSHHQTMLWVVSTINGLQSIERLQKEQLDLQGQIIEIRDIITETTEQVDVCNRELKTIAEQKDLPLEQRRKLAQPSFKRFCDAKERSKAALSRLPALIRSHEKIKKLANGAEVHNKRAL